MEVFHGLDTYQASAPVVLTIGSFDGVHLGHQELIATLKQRADEIGGKSAILTFSPHPRIALNKDKDQLRLLSNDREKEALLAGFGLDLLFFVPFDATFYQQTAEAFLNNILLERIGAKHLVIGYDHRFGLNRAGDIHFLREQANRQGSFTVEEINKQTIDELTVSSSKIRLSIESGDVGLANKLLGYRYALSGMVVKGDQIGRKIGYPTANLITSDPYKQIPGSGVYATKAIIDGKEWPAMTYIGNRPTIAGETNNIETNVLDFVGDLYDCEMSITFEINVRPDVKFESLEALRKQIEIDERKVRLYFGL